MHNSPALPLVDRATDDTRLKLMEAVAQQRIIVARYNGNLIKLAPHLLFERHGDLFVSALNLSKAWRPGDELRLGQFKLSGLSAAKILDEKFDALRSYNAAAPRPNDRLLLAL